MRGDFINVTDLGQRAAALWQLNAADVYAWHEPAYNESLEDILITGNDAAMRHSLEQVYPSHAAFTQGSGEAPPAITSLIEQNRLQDVW